MTEIVAALALFFAGPTAWSRLLLLAGLVLALVNSYRFFTGRESVVMAADGAPPRYVHAGRTRYLRGPDAAIYTPLALVLAGACVGVFRLAPWFLVCSGLLGGLVFLSLKRLRAEHGRRGEDSVAGPVLAVLLSTATLLLVGLVLAVRLAVAPDPSVGFALSFTKDALKEVARSVALPLVVLAALLFAERVVDSRRVAAWRGKLPKRPSIVYLAGVGAVVLLFVAPIFYPEGENDADLVFLELATAEYGKVLFIWVLAVILARYAIGFQARPGKFRADLSVLGARRALAKSKHVVYTLMIFGAVGVAGLLKGDIGPTIPLFAATFTVVVFLLRLQVRSGARLRNTLKASRSLWSALGLVVLVAIPVLQMPYVQTRQDAWHRPWTFNWSVACAPAPSGVIVPTDTPDGLLPCLETLDGASAGKRSQIAQSMAAVADGGLWGRGLSDTLLGQLPAGSTDFILAVAWNKLGGIAIILLAVLLAMLAVALARCRTHLDRFADTDDQAVQRRIRAARLFAAGLAGMLVAQFGFVLVTTLNLLPHSGITAPFLSRGGQSTLALTAGVLMAVWLLYRADRPACPVPTTTARAVVNHTPVPAGLHHGRLRRVAPVGLIAMFLSSAFLATTITIAPYGRYAEDRVFCLTQDARVDPARCSTDRTANRRTSAELRIGGQVQYVRDRAEQEWREGDQPALSFSDLTGLLHLHGTSSSLAYALDPILDGGSGTSLRERVLPTPGGPRAGYVDLTIDPKLQKAATEALRADADGKGPLAGGIVIVDARTGHVLTASSAPSALGWKEDVEPAEPDQGQVEAYYQSHRNYGPINGDRVDESDRDCHTLEWDGRCKKWSLDKKIEDFAAEFLAERRRYAPGTPDDKLPTADQNRALDRAYGLGSTFKVVLAATYLKEPGTTAQTKIPSPPTYKPRFGLPIKNYVAGPCRGTDAAGKITLKQALAVSCNTAFVALAEQLGWAKIRDTATALGFCALDRSTPQQRAWLAGPAAGAASCVPADVDAEGMAGIGNNTLGGGRVVGTPLQMATVMTLLRNGGKAVQPTVVAASADPFGRNERRYRGEARQVLTEAQARELDEALAGVTEDDDGTAHLLRAGDHALRVKTGTHELYGPDEEPPAGEFAKQVAWVVGALDSTAGPVAFAIAVETKDENEGSRRAKWLAQRVIDEVVEVRG
ncbi:penicillin-binding transpeptidase domain-containing protein [Lentzea sp. NEAU-D7]|uniref:penicillin-binding transpeptidase domain-containing protein n=1 Tax=Lentzea sp. NEAU-D7 TaxID=2994667 RepID=UPI00224B3974|nr:penicillin-binding transpeptidase domain-containing protein [Lentzea sp. NEAU-D7]MCX2949698.1 penicillin-binding transpeptidase domain-containing protein [Lentzea sp. NEAU-D7]